MQGNERVECGEHEEKRNWGNMRTQSQDIPKFVLQGLSPVSGLYLRNDSSDGGTKNTVGKSSSSRARILICERAGRVVVEILRVQDEGRRSRGQPATQKPRPRGGLQMKRIEEKRRRDRGSLLRAEMGQIDPRGSGAGAGPVSEEAEGGKQLKYSL
ncbi:hypothetical protein EDC04DRAFT_2696966 [Pisolithus marmoratus]|nr:hypothetical protein EDC04DRAFT_2696966 [Pisolithus marmoratus]